MLIKNPPGIRGMQLVLVNNLINLNLKTTIAVKNKTKNNNKKGQGLLESKFGKPAAAVSYI